MNLYQSMILHQDNNNNNNNNNVPRMFGIRLAKRLSRLIIIVNYIKLNYRAFFRVKGTKYCWDPLVGGGYRVRPGVYLAAGSLTLGIPCKFSF